MDDELYRELQWLTEDELAARRRRLVKAWNRWSRQVDRNGAAAVEGDEISAEIAVVMRVQQERRRR